MTVFPGTPDEMGACAARFVEAGRRARGLVLRLDARVHRRDRRLRRRRAPVGDAAGAAGGRRRSPGRAASCASAPGAPLRVIGERINPTGKKRARRVAARRARCRRARSTRPSSRHAGADLLDVNVGAAGVDAAAVLPQAVLALVGLVGPAARARHHRPGGARGGAARLPGPRARQQRERRAGVASTRCCRLPRATARRSWCSRSTTTASRDAPRGASRSSSASGTAARSVGPRRRRPRRRRARHDRGHRRRGAARRRSSACAARTSAGWRRVLGVSNVSHGLPIGRCSTPRSSTAAAAAGLDAAIVNPNDRVVMEAVRLANQARRRRERSTRTATRGRLGRPRTSAAIAHAAGAAVRAARRRPTRAGAAPRPSTRARRSRRAVLRGDADAAPALVDAVVAAGMPPADGHRRACSRRRSSASATPTVAARCSCRSSWSPPRR